MKARSLLIAALLGFVGLATVDAVQPAIAGAQDWDVDEFNMDTDSANDSVVIYAVGTASPTPWVIALSEVCRTEAENLDAALDAYGFATGTVNFIVTKSNSSVCDNNADRGNAIWIRGSSLTYSPIDTLTQDPNDNAGEVRKGICNRANTFLGYIAACSNHFTKNSGTYAQTQATETRTAMSFLYSGVSKWGAGDFNLRPPGCSSPCTPVPSGWYSNYYEGDDPTNGETRDTHVKNDFIFGAQNTFTGTGSATITPVSTSDHHYYRARFTS